MKRITTVLTILLIFLAVAIQASAKDKNVVVTNGPDQPVPVQCQREPFMKFFLLNFPEGTNLATQEMTIPPGKRLVMETITVATALPEGESILNFQVSTFFDDELVNHVFPLFKQGSVEQGGASSTYFVGAYPVRLYVQPDETVWFYLWRNKVGTTPWLHISVSGYLE